MSVKSMAGILSNKLKSEDIVSIYSYNDDGEIEVVSELQYVRIIAISNASGTNIEDVSSDESSIAYTVTFLVDDLQAEKIITIENEGPMHLALVSRGNSKRAKELLDIQDDILDRIREENDEYDSFEDSFDFSDTFDTRT